MKAGVLLSESLPFSNSDEQFPYGFIIIDRKTKRMATLVQITGPSGSGKSFSIKPLVDAYPSTVAVIDADGRGLAWAG